MNLKTSSAWQQGATARRNGVDVLLNPYRDCLSRDMGLDAIAWVNGWRFADERVKAERGAPPISEASAPALITDPAAIEAAFEADQAAEDRPTTPGCL